MNSLAIGSKSIYINTYPITANLRTTSANFKCFTTCIYVATPLKAPYQVFFIMHSQIIHK